MSLCSVFWQSLHKTLEGGGNGGSGSVVGGGGDVRGVEEGDGGVDGCVGEVGEHEGEGDEGEGDEGEGDGGASPSSWGIVQLGGEGAVSGERAALRFLADLVSHVVAVVSVPGCFCCGSPLQGAVG